MKFFSTFLSGLLVLVQFAHLHAQEKDKTPTEDDYYKLLRFEFREGEVIECGALESLKDGRLAIGTRRGEVWLVENATADDPRQAKFTRYASGMHEILGLAAKDDWLYVTQRCDLSRIKDSKGRGRADIFEVVNDEWGISGDYHEYAFGSRPDKNGDIWIVLCLTGSFTSDNKFRGWCVRITPDGKMIPTCSGIRSPGGIAMNAEGDMFYTDNQGPWHGACALKHLIPGKFMGHPGGFKWYPLAKEMGPTPLEPKSKSRIMTEAKRIPQLEPPAVQFPYGDVEKHRMGQSASGIDCDLSGGKFGPFEKQLFVGDQTYSSIMRVYLEKVEGHYQGACFLFRRGLSCGVVPVRFAGDGSLFAGETNRGWGSRGNRPYGLDRIVWTGKVPFEFHEVHARPDGFELTFTQPLDVEKAADPKSYSVKTYTYIYQADYGSPEVDQTTPAVTKVEVGKDGKSVRLYLSKLEEGHIHEITAAGVRSANGVPLLHNEAHYTLNYIPSK
jgi:hypothetical protein